MGGRERKQKTERRYSQMKFPPQNFFPKIKKDKSFQFQRIHQTLNTVNKNRFILKHHIGNILKIEGNGIYKIPEIEVTYKESELERLSISQ